MPRDFLSHSIRDSRPAIAVKRWRVEQPGEGLSLQQAIKSTPPGSQVREQLAGYQGSWTPSATCRRFAWCFEDTEADCTFALVPDGVWRSLGQSGQPALWPPLQVDGGMADVADEPPRLSTMRGVEPRCVHQFVFVVLVA
jgi:hypothetical protein